MNKEQIARLLKLATGRIACAWNRSLMRRGISHGYWRCPECNCARDFDREVMPDCFECGYEFGVEDFRIAEGWIERGCPSVR